ncbi:EmrB/QacA subfamily drug resistance transporter [Halopolyspora algeriensis]|uniref:EmrB/QacA subfamily drug resistance transporter n=1 Tax=Halopolyspora algeriensis TaxID=1500506 RepID=A0A368VY75_9ACTN|nr:MFS transporter [Halopolyspora algeriensis]RCW47146.1 EmrB/QacA subfamily drug resistance transporter [Halopolyspora algeriensis]TQM48232.1 EmrB/QacA subfamily drug resistance transporter [Halopolyspora algeriensis]
MTTATGQQGQQAAPDEVVSERSEPQASGAPMTRRQVAKAMVGLMLALIVAILSSTIVSTALPVITADLGGTQGQYTWVVTAMLLTSTATTPLWGKLSDLYSKKVLYQLAITIFMLGSVLGGFAQSMSMLIGFRALQGIGMGGLQALIQVVIAAMVSPRERGRYSGYIGAAFAVATTSGPLVGGLIVDVPWLGWRWCFWVTVPIAVIAFIVLGRTLKLPVIKRDVSIDWFGALFLVGGVSLLLAWVSLAGKQFDWLSTQTAACVGGGLLALIIALVIETKVREPIVPLGMFRNPTVSLAIIAMISVGTAMFGGAVFLAQYFQIGRGYSPTHAGLMTLPMVLGLFVSSTLSGQIISRWVGRVKPFLVGGSIVLIIGMGLLSTIDSTTDLVLVGCYLALMGIGVGCLMQNLVLAVQNSVGTRDMGSVTSVVTFFRTLGGSAGVSVLGAVLGMRVTDYVREGLADLPGAPSGGAGSGQMSLDVNALPAPIEEIVRHAYGAGVGDLFAISACVSVVTLLAVLFIREVPLRTTIEMSSDQSGNASNERRNSADGSGEPVDTSENRSAEPRAEQPTVSGPSAAGPRLSSDTRFEGSPPPGEEGGVFVHGTVLDPDGEPVSGVVLTLTDAGGRQIDRTRTGEDGRYRMTPGSGGNCVLIASSGRYQPAASMVAVLDRPVRHDVELSGAAVLSGTVSAGTVPVSGATVVLTDVRGEVVATGQTGAAGDYRLPDLLGGSYAVTVTAQGYRPVAVQAALPDGQETTVDVPLRTGVRLSGVIRSATLGHAIPEAQVTLLDSAGRVAASMVTGADGVYTFTDLPDGEYTVIATGYPPLATPVKVAGEELDHDIALDHSHEEERA